MEIHFSLLFCIQLKMSSQIWFTVGYWAKNSSLMDMCVKSDAMNWSKLFNFFLQVSTEYVCLSPEIKHSPLTCPTCSLTCKFPHRRLCSARLPLSPIWQEVINNVTKECVNPNLSSRLLPLSFEGEWKVHSEKNASTIVPLHRAPLLLYKDAFRHVRKPSPNQNRLCFHKGGFW